MKNALPADEFFESSDDGQQDERNRTVQSQAQETEEQQGRIYLEMLVGKEEILPQIQQQIARNRTVERDRRW